MMAINNGWKRFSTIRKKTLGRGVIFRCLTAELEEKWLDLMMVEQYDSPSAYSLLILNGSSAGMILKKLPIEASNSMEWRSGISVSWLKKNWTEYILNIVIKNVFFKEHGYIELDWKKDQWKKLSEKVAGAFDTGVVFRCPAKWPYEAWVDFMLIAQPDSPSGYSFMVISGHKAGLLRVKLPLEAKSSNGHGISVKWLIENWKKWVYEKGPWRVYYLERFIVDPNWQPIAK